ncbi:hypothetical protein A6A08_23045 [Nocardiopsis sp. TSRI0078]|uniref:hypothetical protein n=1 Tax=unclassified Nocardiopsis TaxID=2649073 RepID=UPI00093CA9E1|nr:hypothetical protein [Nocardiopsis sp. TSRI0078]OKI20437.1 hypothetical protein A6A08_23045 [Nocardiopsis sp. TSRI0078]
MLPVASGTVVVLASTATTVAAVALYGTEPGPPVWGILVVLVVFSLAAAVFLGRRLGGNDGGRGRSGRVLGATGVMTMVVASLFLLVFVLVFYLATGNVLLPTAMTFSYAYFASAVPLCFAAAAAAAWSASRAGRRPRSVRRPRRAWPTAVVSGIVLLLPFVVFCSEPPNTFSTHVPQERREIAADALRRIDDGELPRLSVERACGVGRGEVPAGAAMPPVRDDRWQVERGIGLASADDPVVSGLGRRALAEAGAGDRQAYETLRTAALHYCEHTVAA